VILLGKPKKSNGDHFPAKKPGKSVGTKWGWVSLRLERGEGRGQGPTALIGCEGENGVFFCLVVRLASLKCSKMCGKRILVDLEEVPFHLSAVGTEDNKTTSYRPTGGQR